MKTKTLKKAATYSKYLLVGFLLSFFSFSLPVEAFNDTLNDTVVGLTDPYRKVVRKYTREGAVYSIDQLDTTYKWFATYHSPEFLDAFKKLYDKIYPEDQPGFAKKLKEEVLGSSQAEFFIALYANARGLKRMTGNKNLWDVTLKVGDKILQPSKVESIPLTPFQYRFYPYLEKWYRGYLVIFPYDSKNSPENEMTLRLQSVGGFSQVTFKKQ